MKALLYKEFRLSMHPIILVFTFIFPFMFLIPQYPLFIGTLYIIPMFSVLFLGAKKGIQTHDLFYSALLPIRKRDIVKARMFSVVTLEFIVLALTSALLPLKTLIEEKIQQETEIVFSTNGYLIQLSFVLIGYLLVNACYFILFYKNGRSVLAPSLISTFGYLIYIGIFTMFLPNVQGFKEFLNLNIGYQFIVFGVAILIFAVVTFLIYKKSSKELELADL